MSGRRYAAMVGSVLLLLSAGLLATDQILLCVDQLARHYPYRAHPAMASMGLFLDSWGLIDAIIYFFPAGAYIHQALQAGQMPWWNPLEGVGQPSIASMGLGYSFPVHWLTYGLLHPLLAWHLELALIFLLCSLSSFALFRRLTGSGEAAAIAATAWTFGGWTTAYLQLTSVSWPLALFPLALLAVERGRERFATVQLGVTVMLIITSGHIQFVAPCLGLIALWIVWRGQAKLASGLALLGGVVMAGFHLLPMVELLRLAERPAMRMEFLREFMLQPREYLGMVFPTLMGQPSDNFYFGSIIANTLINGREHCVFIGVFPLLLAVLASLRKATPSSRPVAGLVTLGLLLAGVPIVFETLCKILPPIQFLPPARILPFVLFGVCLLAAQGWADLSARPLQRRETLILLGVLAAFVVGALSFIVPASNFSLGFQEWLFKMLSKESLITPPYFEGDFTGLFISRVLDHFSLRSPAIAASFLVVLGCAVLLYRYIGKRPPFSAVMAVLALDLAMFMAVMNVPQPRAAYFPWSADMEYLSRRTTMATAPAAPLRTMGLRGGPAPSLLLVDGVANFEGYQSTHPGDYRFLMVALNQGEDVGYIGSDYLNESLPSEGAMDLLGLGTIYDSPQHWKAEYGAPDYRGGILGRERPRPLRAFLLNRFHLADRAQAFQAILEPSFDPRAQVLVDVAPSYPNPEKALLQDLQPTEYSACRVAFRVKSDQPTLLVLNDLHYPGWHATVNGKDQPILKAYGFARAVEIGKGESEVVFEFIPTGFPYTPWLGVLVLALLIGFDLRSGRRPSSIPG